MSMLRFIGQALPACFDLLLLAGVVIAVALPAKPLTKTSDQSRATNVADEPRLLDLAITDATERATGKSAQAEGSDAAMPLDLALIRPALEQIVAQYARQQLEGQGLERVVAELQALAAQHSSDTVGELVSENLADDEPAPVAIAEMAEPQAGETETPPPVKLETDVAGERIARTAEPQTASVPEEFPEYGKRIRLRRLSSSTPPATRR